MQTDADLAAMLAEEAGRRLVALRADGGLTGDALGRAGDDAADRFLVEALRVARPADSLLSEESPCDGTRLARSRVWIIDPLDGTREYSEGRDDWAVHVALAVDGVATVGAVALPAAGLVFRSDRPAPLADAADPPRFVVSRTRPSALIAAVAARMGAVSIPMGSAGAKAMAVVRGEADAYLHSGGLREWDSAAPVAVATAYGLHCSRLDGALLRYNRPDVLLPDLLICRPDLADTIIAAVAAAQADATAT